MPIKLSLDSNKIYHKEFEGTKPGYDALQVDSFLDIVIKDYEAMEKYVMDTDQELNNLKAKVKLLNDKLNETEAENAALKARLEGQETNDGSSLNNLDYLKRISKLEKALQKAGINPNTIQ